MKLIFIYSCFIVCVSMGPSYSQETGGTPNAPSESVAKGPNARTVMPKKTSQSKAKAGKEAAELPPWIAADPDRAVTQPRSNSASPGTPAASNFKLDTDSVDYGMKAHGANVSSTQTREQNQNGNVTGIGGQLGIKIPYEW
jgi:hypothetical protein